jgi:hypothetical protein
MEENEICNYRCTLCGNPLRFKKEIVQDTEYNRVLEIYQCTICKEIEIK